MKKHLPSFIFDRIKAGIFGWEYHCKMEIFDRVGPAFILVTVNKNELMVADPEAIHTMASRRMDFVLPGISKCKTSISQPSVVNSKTLW